MEGIGKCTAKKYRNSPDHIYATINRTGRDMRKMLILICLFTLWKGIKKMEKKNMQTKEMKRCDKKFLNKAKQKIAVITAAGVVACNAMTIPVYAAAAGTTAITQPLNSLKTLMLAVIGAVGVIILAKNVMEFAQAYQQQDSSTMNSALKGIVAGIMMAGISSVLTFLGF